MPQNIFDTVAPPRKAKPKAAKRNVFDDVAPAKSQDVPDRVRTKKPGRDARGEWLDPGLSPSELGPALAERERLAQGELEKPNLVKAMGAVVGGAIRRTAGQSKPKAKPKGGAWDAATKAVRDASDRVKKKAPRPKVQGPIDSMLNLDLPKRPTFGLDPDMWRDPAAYALKQAQQEIVEAEKEKQNQALAKFREEQSRDAYYDHMAEVNRRVRAVDEKQDIGYEYMVNPPGTAMQDRMFVGPGDTGLNRETRKARKDANWQYATDISRTLTRAQKAAGSLLLNAANVSLPKEDHERISEAVGAWLQIPSNENELLLMAALGGGAKLAQTTLRSLKAAAAKGSPEFVKAVEDLKALKGAGYEPQLTDFFGETDNLGRAVREGQYGPTGGSLDNVKKTPVLKVGGPVKPPPKAEPITTKAGAGTKSSGPSSLGGEFRNDPEEYAKALLQGHGKGNPGIHPKTFEGGQPGYIFRDESGKAVGILKHDGEKVTDIAVSKNARRQGIGTQLVERAKQDGVTGAKGPYTPASAALNEKTGLTKATTTSSTSPATGPKTGAGPTVETPNIFDSVAPPKTPNSAAPKIPLDQIKTTGLANQVQKKEAEILGEIPAFKGHGPEHWQARGEELVSKGASYEDLAEKVMRGEATLDGDAGGILLAGKRRLMKAVDDARATLREDPTNTAKQQAYEQAQEKLQIYASKVQAGKGQWSDFGRALQAGTDINEGSFAEVLEEAGRFRKVGDNRLKEFEDLTGKVAEKDAKIAELEQQLKEAQAGRVVTGTRTRKFDKEAIGKEIDAIFEEFAAVKGSGGVKQGRTRGAVAKFTRKDWEALKTRASLNKRLATAYVRMGAANLEEVVVKVQAAIKERLGIDATRQEIIDDLAVTETRTKSELQKTLTQLRQEARRESTLAKQRLSTKAAERAAQKKALADYRQQFERTQKAARRVDELERASESATRKADLAAAKAAQREADKRLRELKARAEREFGDQWNYQQQVFDVEERIADLKAQIDSGNFKVATPAEKKATKELEDLRAERDVYAGKVRQALQAHKAGMGDKVARGTAGIIRGAQLGMDVGVVKRQGLFTWSRPLTALKATGRGVTSAISEKTFEKTMREIEEKRVGGQLMSPIRKQSGLQLTDHRLNPEELSITGVIRKIPVIGPKIGGSLERFQHAWINYARAETFDRFYAAGRTTKELEQRASFINNATGRGNLKQIHPALELVLTSPRYEASRWSMMGEVFRNPARFGADLVTGKGLNKAALANMQDMAVTAGEVLLMMKLAEAGGYTVSWDWRSPDFLKMRKGEEVWDPTAGVSPRLRDTLRLLHFWDKDGQNVGEFFSRTGVRALSPGIRTPVEVANYQTRIRLGEDPKKIESPFTGFADPDEEKGWWLFAPLIVQTARKYLEDGDVPGAVFAAAREFVGESISRYPQKETFGFSEPVQKALDKLDYTAGLPKQKEGESDALFKKRKELTIQKMREMGEKAINNPAFKRGDTRAKKRVLKKFFDSARDWADGRARQLVK